MSISLLVQFRDSNREELYLPVGTAAAFSKYWAATAEGLQLELVPQLEWRSLLPGDLPALVGEIAALRREFERRGLNDLVERADFILEAIHAIDPADVSALRSV